MLGLFLALALDPIVRMLERRGRKRGTGIAFVFAGFLVIIGFFTIFLLPPVVNQIGQFITTAPEAILAVQNGEWFAQLNADAQAAVSAALVELSATLSSPEFIAAIGGGALALGHRPGLVHHRGDHRHRPDAVLPRLAVRHEEGALRTCPGP